MSDYGDHRHREQIGDDLEGHHIPSQKLLLQYGINSLDGASVVMRRDIHKLTRTYGGRSVAAFTEDIVGSFADAIERDITDYANIGGPDPERVGNEIRNFWRARDISI